MKEPDIESVRDSKEEKHLRGVGLGGGGVGLVGGGGKWGGGSEFGKDESSSNIWLQFGLRRMLATKLLSHCFDIVCSSC